MWFIGLSSGTPGGIRTSNRLIRSQVLYPIELRVHLFESPKDKKLYTAGQFILESELLIPKSKSKGSPPVNFTDYTDVPT